MLTFNVSVVCESAECESVVHAQQKRKCSACSNLM